MKRHREIKIGSALEEMFRVEQFVEELSDEHMLYGSYFGNIMMALTEAVQNAMVHGNGLDRTKLVRVREEMSREGLWISVSDEGNGFNFREYIEKESLAGSGSEKRGLFIMLKLCDELSFMHNGQTVRMLFRIHGIDEKIYSRREAFMQDFFRVYQRLSI